ncbi:MAG: trigger factor [Candidatus Omnitrophica bacterium]|nr:trigger factor [Candidatus Omnitrophota bacterium]
MMPLKLEILQSKISPCQQQMRIALASEAIHPVRDVVVREFQKEAVLAGFRKGKAPRELVERQFQTNIREELIRRLTRQVFQQATEERRLRPVGPFEVTKLELDDAKGLSLEARVEVEPEFSVADYRGVRLVKPPVSVAPEEIEKALGQLQESMAQLVPAGEGKPKEKRLPNLDDELAKDVGFERVEQLRAHLEATLREQKTARQRQTLEHDLCEALLARHQFDVPPRLIAKQTERLTRDFQARLLLAGMTEEQVKTELAKYTEQLRTNAVRAVKLAFILERIADAETLSVTQDELVDRLWKLAKRWKKDPTEVRRLLDAQGLWPSIASSIRQDKTIEFVLSVAQIEEAATSGQVAK